MSQTNHAVPIQLMVTLEKTKISDQKVSIENYFLEEETPLLRYAYAIVRRREVAEELVQEAFMRAHQHWHEVEQPKAWLYRAVRNLALNHLRKHKRESLTGEEHQEESQVMPDQQTRRLEVATQLRALMAEMSEPDRELIRLKYEEDLPYATIGEKLGIGVGNVGYRLHHLLKSLGDGLKRVGVEDAALF